MDFVDTFLNADVLLKSAPSLLTGLQLTFLLGMVSILISLAGGLFLALVRLYGPRPVAMLAIGFIDLFRAVPMLVLLIIIYYALPFAGLRLSPFAAATTAMSIVASAYVAEIIRSGIQAVPRGQFEASNALGMSFRQQMADIVLPQAFRIIIPPLTNNSINVIKDTALASVVAMPDLLKQATLQQSILANPTPLIGAAAIYVLLLLPMVRVVTFLEKRIHKGATR